MKLSGDTLQAWIEEVRVNITRHNSDTVRPWTDEVRVKLERSELLKVKNADGSARRYDGGSGG